MANLQTTGPIALSQIKALFGGAASASLSNYYRGGAYIPSSKTVSTLVKEPPDGSAFNGQVPVSSDGEWWISSLYKGVWFTFSARTIWWNDVQVATGVDASAASITIGEWTYHKSNYVAYSQLNSGYVMEYGYAVRRTQGGSSTVSINGGVPSSGTIRFSQLYGAEKP